MGNDTLKALILIGGMILILGALMNSPLGNTPNSPLKPTMNALLEIKEWILLADDIKTIIGICISILILVTAGLYAYFKYFYNSYDYR